MSGTQNLFTTLSQLSHIQFVTITDGRTYHISGEVVQISSQLSLKNVLSVPNFPVNLLSIRAITKQLRCYVTFFPFHCTFRDLQTGKRIS